MNLIITIILGFVIAFATSQLRKYRQPVQARIFCIAMYVLEVLQCIFVRSIRLFTRNACISIILMIILPFIVLFIFYTVCGIKQSKKSANEQEE